MMIVEAGLKGYFWAEIVNTTCFTQNISLVVKRHSKTAYEILRGKKPDISFFHIFGSTCYVLNTRDQLKKFDPKADEDIFVGYSLISKAFRVYNLRRETIEESVHVTFEESFNSNKDLSTSDSDFDFLDSFPISSSVPPETSSDEIPAIPFEPSFYNLPQSVSHADSPVMTSDLSISADNQTQHTPGESPFQPSRLPN